MTLVEAVQVAIVGMWDVWASGVVCGTQRPGHVGCNGTSQTCADAPGVQGTWARGVNGSLDEAPLDKLVWVAAQDLAVA